GVPRKRISTGGDILSAGGVAKKCLRTLCRVVVGDVIVERVKAVGRVVVNGYAVYGAVSRERPRAGSRVVAADGVFQECTITDGGVVAAGGERETIECIPALSRVAPRIVSVRCRRDGLRNWCTFKKGNRKHRNCDMKK